MEKKSLNIKLKMENATMKTSKELNHKHDGSICSEPAKKLKGIVEKPSCSDTDAVKHEHDERERNDQHNNQILEGNSRVVATHYNTLRESGRQERQKSRILHMRNFNNWTKSMLINEYMRRIRDAQRTINEPVRVLDMCCGKGGDLLKWSKANIQHLICTDIAKVSVEQCEERYKVLRGNGNRDKFRAEFFDCDATLVRLRERYHDKSIKLNLVSCQFAFHYSFESLSQADCMVRNAAECLDAGGYFIATMPDANEIMRRLHKSTNKRSFGNEIYNIEFQCDTEPPPLFGAKYQFHLEEVVDCPEFLVHFGTLTKLCRKHGLILERRSTFREYYLENAEAGRALLQRMSGFETIYIDRLENDTEYEHVKNLPKSSNNQQSRPVGTLSKSEWEVITLYLVCAFRKVKSSLDFEGKPIYHFEEDQN